MTRRPRPSVGLRPKAGQLELEIDTGGVVYVDNAAWIQEHIADSTSAVTHCGLPFKLGRGAFITRARSRKPLCPSCQ